MNNMKYFEESIIIIILFSFSTKIYSIQPLLRNKILCRQDNKCGLCKKNFSKMVPHEIHHINGVSNDNDKNNLLALCCNCHSAHHRFNISVKPYFNNLKNSSNVKPYFSEFV
tara:strand:- start:78 stop:413 length:336 start_codon:yes stop_codon:yes gene_type:complete